MQLAKAMSKAVTLTVNPGKSTAKYLYSLQRLDDLKVKHPELQSVAGEDGAGRGPEYDDVSGETACLFKGKRPDWDQLRAIIKALIGLQR